MGIQIVWRDRVYLDKGEEVSAATNLQTGLIELSKTRLQRMPQNWITFIIEHEKAHYILQTFNEIACDAHAFKECVKKGIPLEDLIKAISRILVFTDNPNSLAWQRFEAQKQRAFRVHQLRKNGM